MKSIVPAALLLEEKEFFPLFPPEHSIDIQEVYTHDKKSEAGTGHVSYEGEETPEQNLMI